MEVVNIADIVNKKTGKTFREENNEKKHNIPLGSLVEVDFDDSYLESPKKGLRLFVVEHTRDCDGTPLYSLSFMKNWNQFYYGDQLRFATMAAVDKGYSEDCLKFIS